MNTYTPGPWRLEGRSVITDGFQHSDRNSEICTVSGSREFGTEHGENELFHNAQLIAAAPDLAEALRGFIHARNHSRGDLALAERRAIEALTKAGL
jgi:hypothetical protein